MLYQFVLSMHLIASLVWVGSVFMGTFIDWAAARKTVAEGKFPFRFIIGQGTRVFYSVYFGIILLWTSGTALVILSPPQSQRDVAMLAFKIVALLIMTANTLHGTFSTWPKLQLATHKEAFRHYRFYLTKAKITFLCGLLASVVGLWMYYQFQ